MIYFKTYFTPKSASDSLRAGFRKPCGNDENSQDKKIVSLKKMDEYH